MKRKLYFILAAVCLLLAITACQSGPEPSPDSALEPESTEQDELVPAPEPEEEPAAEPEIDPTLSQRDRDWIEDIEFLREKYKTEHMDLFYVCSEAEFDWRLDRLETKVNQLSDEDIFFELKAVIAGMGDIHTYINPSEAVDESLFSRRFPLRVQCFGDKLYLCGYLDGYDQFAPYLLREITAINGIDMAYLKTKAASITLPFGDGYSKAWFVQYCLLPAFLDWAGCDYKEGYTFQILNENQEVESIAVPLITSAEFSAGTWIYPENWDRLFCGRNGDWTEYVEGENGGCIYMHYVELASAAAIIKIFDTAAELIDEHPDCGKLVIDLRDHPGGAAARVDQVRESTKRLDAPTIEQTYVVTGGRTTSGAIACTAVFQDILDAVVIGEPTGQFASFFYVQDLAGMFVLPHSQFSGGISNG